MPTGTSGTPGGISHPHCPGCGDLVLCWQLLGGELTLRGASSWRNENLIKKSCPWRSRGHKQGWQHLLHRQEQPHRGTMPNLLLSSASSYSLLQRESPATKSSPCATAEIPPLQHHEAKWAVLTTCFQLHRCWTWAMWGATHLHFPVQ